MNNLVGIQTVQVVLQQIELTIDTEQNYYTLTNQNKALYLIPRLRSLSQLHIYNIRKICLSMLFVLCYKNTILLECFPLFLHNWSN